MSNSPDPSPAAAPWVSAVLLAAGLSTRMGERNKLLLPFRGSTFIEHTVNVLLASRLDEVVVVLGHEAGRVRPCLERSEMRRPLTVVVHPGYGEGMGSSLKAGLRRTAPQADAIMVCLTDLPLLEPGDIDRVIDAFGQATMNGGGQDILVPFHRGQRGNPVLFSARYREEVLATRGPIAGCRGIVQRYPEAVLAVEMDNDHILRDIDTPEDYRALVKLSPAGSSP
ncbi:MAG: nucleotidyltransferase family protein [SAR324 cluster bacterium]|nr:nucleotidyltransferase family protein [SAR324 cluster bacterium]